MNRIGIDLGGTKIEGILLDENGSTVERKRIPTKREDGYASIVERIVLLIKNLENMSSEEVGIGVCTPGAISPVTGMLKNSNTICLIGKPLKEDIEESIGKKIKMENDANCFTLAEAEIGAAKNHDVVFGVIMGTGVGGGIYINDKIHNGRMAIAGEWGHHTLYPNGNECYCGNNGCVETYISGPALERRWTELSGKPFSLVEIVKHQTVSKYFKQWKNELINNFGIALANIIDILDPDTIVLGGGVSNIDFLYDEGVAAVHKYVFSDNVDTPILKNQLGDSAGVFGAAYLN